MYRLNTIKKQDAFKRILNELGIPVIDLYLSKGSTVTRAGLREVDRVLNPNGPKNLLKHEVAKSILRELEIPVKISYFSKGSTVTTEALVDILEALGNRKYPEQAA